MAIDRKILLKSQSVSFRRELCQRINIKWLRPRYLTEKYKARIQYITKIYIDRDII